MAKSEYTRTATVELIGLADNLSKATILIGIVGGEEGWEKENLALMLGFVKFALPDWEGSTDWVSNNLTRAFTSGPQSTVHERVTLTLEAHKDAGMVTLALSGKM